MRCILHKIVSRGQKMSIGRRKDFADRVQNSGVSTKTF